MTVDYKVLKLQMYLNIHNWIYIQATL